MKINLILPPSGFFFFFLNPLFFLLSLRLFDLFRFVLSSRWRRCSESVIVRCDHCVLVASFFFSFLLFFEPPFFLYVLINRIDCRHARSPLSANVHTVTEHSKRKAPQKLACFTGFRSSMTSHPSLRSFFPFPTLMIPVVCVPEGQTKAKANRYPAFPPACNLCRLPKCCMYSATCIRG